jgi:hypothetical protein
MLLSARSVSTSNWRALLTKHDQDGRRLLREILAEPLYFTPEDGTFRSEHRLPAALIQLAGKHRIEIVLSFYSTPQNEVDEAALRRVHP